MNYEQMEKWTFGRAKELEMDIDIELIKNIYSLCGGCPRLIKNFLRAFRELNDFEQAQNSTAFSIALKTLWGQFSENEVLLLKQLKVSKKVSSELGEIYKYFEESGLIEKNKIKPYWLNIQLNQEMLSKFQIKKGKPILDGIDVSPNFSKRELKFIGVINELKFISKDDIAEMFFKNEIPNEGTIDKFISRLRSKFIALGIGEDVLETVKRKGIRWNLK